MCETTILRIKEEKIIAIVRNFPQDELCQLGEGLLAGGIKCIEITFAQHQPDTWHNTAQSISYLNKQSQNQMLVGAGTVLTITQLHMAYEAGAKYIVAPNVDISIIKETKRLGLVCLPGALTPTEIVTAYDAGADMLKVFPVSNLGLAYVKAIRAPLSHIPIVAVGGINENNATDFIKAGCCAVGVGGSLVNAKWIHEGGDIVTLAKSYKKAVEEA